MTNAESIEERLSRLWQEGSRDFAIAFFKRAINQNMTLAEIAATLRFDALQDDLANIRLGDVISSDAAGPYVAPTAPVVLQKLPTVVEKLPTVEKKTRRRAKQTQEIKEMLVDCLKKASAGLTTSDLSNLLQREGYGVDTMQTNMILKGMENDGAVTGDNGRPRTWRVESQGRKVAEPVIIRKARPRPPQTMWKRRRRPPPV